MKIPTPDQRLRVFVSSTLEELASERAAARQAIAQLRLSPVMFEGGARPYPPRDVYLNYLMQSDVFVGIYWQRYGWVAPGQNISGLEDEYRLSRGKPRLLYVKTPAPDREPNLSALLDRIISDGSSSYRLFTTHEELQQHIAGDLALLLSDRFASTVDAAAEPARPAAPLPRARVIGRDRELAELKQLLESRDARLVTLTGPGGVGKTTLALAAAAASAERFEDGTIFVPMASTTDKRLVAATVARAVGLPETGDRPLGTRLIEYLRTRNLLLLLDNVEQLVDAAPLASQALEMAPRLKILTTSREALRVRDETVVPVAPLQLPPAGWASERGVEGLLTIPTVALFVERARAALPTFELTPDDAPAVVEICRRLDGIPLAVELAAARSNLLSPASMLQHIRQARLPLLSRGPRDLPHRQQTLRSTLDWSYTLLNEPDRTMFRRLAVFVGGFTLESVEAVCASSEKTEMDVLDSLESLVDKSLITRAGTGAQQGRFHMLDTIREYALDVLSERGETEAVGRAHAAHFADLAETASRGLRGPEQVHWMERLREERDNLRAVLDWALSRGTEMPSEAITARTQLGLKMGAALWYFWFADGSVGEGRRWLERLDSPDDGGPGGDGSQVTRGMVVAGAGWLANVQSEPDRAVALAERSLLLAGGQAPEVAALAGATQGGVAINAGNLEQASALFERLLDSVRSARLSWWTAVFLNNLGFVAYLRGDLTRARTLVEESAGLRREIGDLRGLASSLLNLGAIAWANGDVSRAHRLYLESLRLVIREGAAVPLATDLLEDLAGVLARDHPQLAARLLGAVDAFHTTVGVPGQRWRRAGLDRTAAELQRLLGPDAYGSIRAEGAKLPIDQAIGQVLAADGPTPSPALRATPGRAFSTTEVAVNAQLSGSSRSLPDSPNAPGVGTRPRAGKGGLSPACPRAVTGRRASRWARWIHVRERRTAGPTPAGAFPSSAPLPGAPLPTAQS